MSSILTNNSAMTALQTLKSINSNMAKTQSEISTGKSVASAKDNAATWAISKVMETDQSGFKVIQKQLNAAESTVSVAMAGAEEVTTLLNEMKDLAVGATRDGADFDKINTDIVAKKEQITSIVNASQSNGINLLKTDIGNGGGTFSVLASLDRTNGTAATTQSTITVASADLEANVVGATVTTISDTATAGTAIGEIEGSARDHHQRRREPRLVVPAAHRPERVRRQAVGQPEVGHRRAGGRRHGGGLGPPPGAANAAAARRPVAVDRQPGAAGDPVAVPLIAA